MLLQVILAAASLASGVDEDEKELVRMPLNYKQATVVIVSSQGAGRVRFFDPFEIGNQSSNGIVGISYEWRYLERKPNAVLQTGTGRVFAKLVKGAVNHASSNVTCGPFHFTWEYADNKSGVVRFNPLEAAFHPVAGELFTGRQSAKKDTAYLKRFLYANETATDQGIDVYPGPDSEMFDTVSPVPYAKCVLVAKDRHGIATFKFGRAFERVEDEIQRLQVVTYDFSFTSRNENSSRTGNSEVFSRLRGRNHDGERLYLDAGTVHLAWSPGDKDYGWIYYDAASLGIWYVDAADAEVLINAVRLADFLPESEVR